MITIQMYRLLSKVGTLSGNNLLFITRFYKFYILQITKNQLFN
jgi:hypothetical protein